MALRPIGELYDSSYESPKPTSDQIATMEARHKKGEAFHYTVDDAGALVDQPLPTGKVGGLRPMAELFGDREYVGTPKPKEEIKPPTFGDYAKELGASAFDAFGFAAQAGGEILAKGLNAATGTQDFRASNPLESLTDGVMRESMTPGGKAAREDGFQGSVVDLAKGDFDKIELPKTTSGLAMAFVNGLGSVAAMVVPGSMALKGARGATAAGAAMGGATTGGAAANEIRQNLEALQQADWEKVPAYQDARAKGMSDGDTKLQVTNYAAQTGGALSAIAGAAGGAFNSRFLEDLVAKKGMAALLGKVSEKPLGRAAAGAVAGGLTGGFEETAEKVGQNVGENIGLGLPAGTSAARDTLGDFAGGVMVGKVTGGVAGAVSSKSPTEKIAEPAKPILAAKSVDEAIAVATAAVAEPTKPRGSFSSIDELATFAADEKADLANRRNAIALDTANKQKEFADLAKSEQSDLAYLRRDAALEAQKQRDFAPALEQVRDQTIDQANALTRVSGVDSGEPTAMQLAMQAARAKRGVQESPLSTEREQAPKVDAAPLTAQEAPNASLMTQNPANDTRDFKLPVGGSMWEVNVPKSGTTVPNSGTQNGVQYADGQPSKQPPTVDTGKVALNSGAPEGQRDQAGQQRDAVVRPANAAVDSATPTGQVNGQQSNVAGVSGNNARVQSGTGAPQQRDARGTGINAGASAENAVQDDNPNRRATPRYNPEVTKAFNRARELLDAAKTDADYEVAYKAMNDAEDLRLGIEKPAPKFKDFTTGNNGEVKQFDSKSAAARYQLKNKVRGYTPREQDGRWVLSKPFKPRSEKQLANDAKKKAKTEPIDILRDELQVALRKMGGIDIDEALANGFDKADIARANIPGFGNRKLFRKGGMSLDAAREAIAQGSEQAGYLDPNQADDLNHFIDRLMDSVKEQASYYSFAGQEYQLAMSEAAKEADRGRSGVQLDREDQAEAGIDSLPKQEQNEVQAAWASIDRSMLERIYPSDVIEELSAAEAQRRKEQEDEITAFAEREAISENGERSPADRTGSAQDDRGDEPRSARRGDEGNTDEAGQGTRSEVKRKGGTPLNEAQQLANTLAGDAAELGMQIRNESEESDFDPTEVSQAVANWADGKKYSAEDLRQAVIKDIAKRPSFDGKTAILRELSTSKENVAPVNTSQERVKETGKSEQVAPKQPWQMTFEEYRASVGGTEKAALKAHRNSVIEASKAGETIPPQILREDAELANVLNAPVGSSAPTTNKPKPGIYSGPADVSSRDGQIELANRAGTIASIQSLNSMVRGINETAAYTDGEISNAKNIDAIRDYLSAIVASNAQSQQPDPLTATLNALNETMGRVAEALTLQNQSPSDLAAKKAQDESKAAEEKRIADLERTQPLTLQNEDKRAEGDEARKKAGQGTMFSRKSADKITDSEGFKNWQGNATLVRIGDKHQYKSGEPVVVEGLHGTTSDFTVFNRSKASVESDLGAGFYVTNTREDVGTNYAGLGPDLTGKVERTAEMYEQTLEDDDWSEGKSAKEIKDEAMRRARADYMNNEGFTMPVFVKFENPVVLGGKGETFLDMTEDYNEETEEYGEPTGKLIDLVDALRNTDTGRFGDADIEQAIGDLYEAARDYEGLKASDAIRILGESEGLQYATDYEGTGNGDLASKEIIRLAFQEAGFDGFIDQTPYEKFGPRKIKGGYGAAIPVKGMEGIKPDTVHFIAFEPNQIKSAIGNRGTFDPNSDNILFSRGGIWKSQMLDAIGTLMANQEPAKALSLKVEAWAKAGKFKQDELTWSGLSDWLKTQDGKVTKQQIQDFIRENGVQVEEVVLGENDEKPDFSQYTREELGQLYEDEVGHNPPEENPDMTRATLERDLLDIYADPDSAEPGQTKFSQYQLPGGPLSRDTEILTREGWMRIDAVEIGEEVLTRRDEDAGLEWAPVEAKPEVFAEKLYHFASQSINMRVTPCHKMVVKRRRRSKGGLFRVTAQELWGMAECVSPLTGKWSGEQAELLYGLPANDVAELTGWYIAEGSSVTSRTKHKSTLAIAQSREANSEKCARLEALFGRLAIKWNYVGGSYYLSIRSMPRDLVEMLHAQPLSDEKYVPGFMFSLSSEIQQSLLEGLMLGDGCEIKQAGRKNRKVYFTNSKQLADDVQVLALMTGKRGTVKQRPNGLYTVAINSKEWASIDDAKSDIVDYNDTAYCVTVKNHSIYVRTNGIAAFTGNSNYRELLLTLPEKSFPVRDAELRKNAAGKWAWFDGDKQITGAFDDKVDAEWQAPKYHTMHKRSDVNFRSSHFDQPNILAHIRFNERTDAEGKRVLFVEEIQSDWAQKGRKDGFATSELKNERAEDYPIGSPERWRLAHGNHIEAGKSNVPSAPFVHKTEAWTSLAMKRMVKYAIDNGFDKIAWTNGEQQAARYDLSKHLDSVGYKKNADGTFNIAAFSKNHGVPWSNKAATLQVIEDTLGKEIAKKVEQDEGRKTDGQTFLEGLDLKVGGEGMRGYYDKIIPNVANDLLKKLGGGRVETVEISQDHDAGSNDEKDWNEAAARSILRRGGEIYVTDKYHNETRIKDEAALDELMADEGIPYGYILGDKQGTTAQIGFTITPAMRESAQGGLPLFARNQKGTISPNEFQTNEENRQYTDQLERALQKGGGTFRATPVLPQYASDETGGRGNNGRPIQKDNFRLAEKVAGVFGKQVVWVRADGDFGINGVIVGSIKDKIFIDVRTKVPAHAVMGHEMSHWIEKDSPEIYSRLMRALDKVLIRHEEYRAKYNIPAEETKADISKEIVGDLMGDAFADPQFWSLVAQENPGPIRGIANKIMQWLNNAIAKFNKAAGFGSDAYVNDLKVARHALAKAVAEYALLKKGATQSDATGEYSKAYSDPGDPQFHRAFHGTPHDFDQFSLDKIGTGEGAQAYGHGLYFAGKREVAEYYKNALGGAAKLVTMRAGKPYKVDSAKAIDRIRKRAGDDVANEVDELVRMVATGETTLQQAKREAFGMASRSDWAHEAHMLLRDVNSVESTGKLYEVELAPKESEYLDWDKPLSEQSEKVRGIIGEVERKRLEPMLAEREARRAEMENSGKDTAAIDRQISVLKEEVANNKLGDSLGGSGERYYKSLSMKMGGDQAASAHLKSIGIPGIKYLDGSSRSKGEGHHNYVIFDAKDVTITAKYSRTAADQSAIFNHLRSASTAKEMTGRIASLLESDNTFNRLTKNINTQFHKAQLDKDFKRVFDAVQSQMSDTEHYAIEAEKLAPDVLIRMQGFSDIGRTILQGGKQYAADMKAIAQPLFANIEGKQGVRQFKYTDAELKSEWKLTEKQIKLYHQYQAATAQSIDRLAQAKMLETAISLGMDVSGMKNLSLEDTHALLKSALFEAAEEKRNAAMNEGIADADRAKLQKEATALYAIRDQLDKMNDNARELIVRGYTPAMRFGDFEVRGEVLVQDEKTGKAKWETKYMGRFESQAQANAMKIALQKEHPEWKVTKGKVNPNAYKMLKGVSPESFELMAQITGNADEDGVKQYIALAKSSRAAEKRLLERQGIAGFSEDASRVLAAFVTSNARATAQALNSTAINEALASKTLAAKGDVQAEAQNLVEYVSNPNEEASKLRGLLFMHYMGGSIASGLVNLTQPILQTAPHITKYVSGLQAFTIMKNAAKAVATNKIPEKYKSLYQKAIDDGITEPHEIHQLMADAGGSTLGRSLRARAFVKAWGGFFSLSEAFNRKVTFLAAIQAAEQMGPAKLKEAGFKSAYEFAKDTIIETQGLYNKGNRPNMARGALGATIFTFKQFSIAWVEWLSRLPRKQQMIALAMLILASGLEGLPFAEDIEDLIDTLGHRLGYATNSRKSLRNAIASTIGQEAAEYVLHGSSRLTALDLSGRLGMGNLIPGTAFFDPANKNKGKEILDVLGAAGGLAKGVAGALDGDIAGTLPTALKNIAKAYQMADTGEYKDSKGRQVMKTDSWDAIVKLVGFQPTDVAEASKRTTDAMNDLEIIRYAKGEIADRWAQGIIEKKPDMVKEARQELTKWNLANPDMRVSIKSADIDRRVKEARLTRDQRILKSAPAGLKQSVMADLAQ